MWKLANPTIFLDLVRRIAPWVALLSAALFAFGLYGVAGAPDDYQQGATVKIMFIHVPSAVLAMGGWGLMFLSAIGALVWRHPLAEVSMKAAAPIGAAFTFLCLATGSLWGQPTWGTWWVWDARLTSVLVLFIMYLGVISLWRTIEDPGRAARACAILVLVGAVNLPIIKFSVEWWNTLHQSSSGFLTGSRSIDPSMRWPLYAMALAFLLFFVTVHALAMRNEILRRRVRTMRLMAASAQPATPLAVPAGTA
jgi:heme exporter protein C